MGKTISIEKRLADGAVTIPFPVDGWFVLSNVHDGSSEWYGFLVVNAAEKQPGDRKRRYHLAFDGERFCDNVCRQMLNALSPTIAETAETVIEAYVRALSD